MSIFNKKGMLVFPKPKKEPKVEDQEKLLVFTECFCPCGHNLIDDKAQFDEFKGIYLKVSRGQREGFIALSPVYGNKTRVAVGMKLKEGTQYKLSCPKCDAVLPIFTKCYCGGKIFTLFLNRKGSFDSFIGACSRIGCENSYIQIGEELITSVRLDMF